MSNEKQKVCVTPPGAESSHRWRCWLESQAAQKGFTDLEWRGETDCHGNAAAALYGTPTQ